VYCTHKFKKIKSRIPRNVALLQPSRVFVGLLQWYYQVSPIGYPLLRLRQWALEQWFTFPLGLSTILSLHTTTSPNLICPGYDDSTRSVRLMKYVVVVFKDPHGWIWPMIVTMQKWLRICNLLIQDRLVTCSCSTVTGELCIIVIMISRVWD